jgi:hypothetical protein
MDAKAKVIKIKTMADIQTKAARGSSKTKTIKATMTRVVKAAAGHQGCDCQGRGHQGRGHQGRGRGNEGRGNKGRGNEGRGLPSTKHRHLLLDPRWQWPHQQLWQQQAEWPPQQCLF